MGTHFDWLALSPSCHLGHAGAPCKTPTEHGCPKGEAVGGQAHPHEVTPLRNHNMAAELRFVPLVNVATLLSTSA